MSKLKDDWLHPERSYVAAPDPKEKPYLIVRLKAPEPCTWLGSPPRPSYREWSAFATEVERDAELKRLRKTTEWVLRPAKRDWSGHGWEVEDEETDLLARLALLRRARGS